MLVFSATPYPMLSFYSYASAFVIFCTILSSLRGYSKGEQQPRRSVILPFNGWFCAVRQLPAPEVRQVYQVFCCLPATGTRSPARISDS